MVWMCFCVVRRASCVVRSFSRWDSPSAHAHPKRTLIPLSRADADVDEVLFRFPKQRAYAPTCVQASKAAMRCPAQCAHMSGETELPETSRTKLVRYVIRPFDMSPTSTSCVPGPVCSPLTYANATPPVDCNIPSRLENKRHPRLRCNAVRAVPSSHLPSSCRSR